MTNQELSDSVDQLRVNYSTKYQEARQTLKELNEAVLLLRTCENMTNKECREYCQAPQAKQPPEEEEMATEQITITSTKIPPEEPVKLCKDCKFSSKVFHSILDCDKFPNPVDGAPLNCECERDLMGHCKPEGLHWEPRPSWFSRIKKFFISGHLSHIVLLSTCFCSSLID